MKTILICLAFLVAYCYSTGLTIVDLPANTNTAVHGKLTLDQDEGLLIYRVFLLRNASSITISISQTDAVCDSLVLKGRTGQAPCPDAEDGERSVCQGFTWYQNFDGEDNTYTLTSESDNDGFESRWETNQYIYFGVGKEFFEDDDNNCTFTINSITTTYCGAGTIATNNGDTATCTAYTPITFGTPFSIATTNDAVRIFSANLPGTSYGNVHILVNSTFDNLRFFTKTGAAPDDGEGGYSYDCFDNSESEIGGFFISSFDCPTPIGGNWWYFVVSNDDEDEYSATITITVKTCTTSGTGGWNCTAPNAVWSPKSPVASGSLPANAAWAFDEYTFCYFYYDVNATLPQNPFTFSVTSTVGSGYIYFKYNGYPESNSPYGYSISDQFIGLDTLDTETYYVYPGDLATSSRIYFGISTVEESALSFHLNGTQTTTGAPTTSAPTGGGNTGHTTTGDAFALTASLFLVAIAFIATLI